MMVAASATACCSLHRVGTVPSRRVLSSLRGVCGPWLSPGRGHVPADRELDAGAFGKPVRCSFAPALHTRWVFGRDTDRSGSASEQFVDGLAPCLAHDVPAGRLEPAGAQAEVAVRPEDVEGAPPAQVARRLLRALPPRGQGGRGVAPLNAPRVEIRLAAGSAGSCRWRSSAAPRRSGCGAGTCRARGGSCSAP